MSKNTDNKYARKIQLPDFFAGTDGNFYICIKQSNRFFRFETLEDANHEKASSLFEWPEDRPRTIVIEDEAAQYYNSAPPAPLSPKNILNTLTQDVEKASEQNEETYAKSEADGANENPKSDFDTEITAKDLLSRKVESIPCLVEPIIQQVGLVAVAGSSDVGKSSFLRQFGFAIATKQKKFLGWPIRAKYHSSIYVSSEDDENATAFLLHSLNKIQQQQPEDCGSLRFIFDTSNLLSELDNRLTRNPADLVIIDAFGDLYTGDANKTNQIRQFLHDYSQLAQKHGCLIMWLHHTGKRTDDEAPSKHNVIGGQGFEGKMRLLVELRRDHHDDSRRHLCIVKGNYLPDEYKAASYVLSFENFVFSQTGERVPFEQLAKPKEEVDSGVERYRQIQEARQSGHKGDALSKHLGWSKAYISQVERKYGPKSEPEPELSKS